MSSGGADNPTPTFSERVSRAASTSKESGLPGWVVAVALAAGALVAIANVSGLAIPDDGVGYRAIADSILAGDGLGFFLEDPLTIWPPLWPALIAAVSWLSPLTTTGAAIVLNVVIAGVTVLVAYGLLRRILDDPRLVMAGTLVMGLGPLTMGFGHLLITDAAFALVVLIWLRTMIRFHDSSKRIWLLAAGLTVWLGFGLRYVAIYLLGLGGLWLLFDGRRRFASRIADSVLYGLTGMVVPLLWMLRNHSIDGTFTGERTSSARGLVDNGFDILTTMGRWLLPGTLDSRKYLWAAVGGVVLVAAAYAAFKVLRAVSGDSSMSSSARKLVSWIGTPAGLLAVQAFGYLTYMLYVRTTTALNQLELRLLNPSYFSMMALVLLLVSNLHRIPGPSGVRWDRVGHAVVWIWAAANVVAGVTASVTFAAGRDYFKGNYESDVFADVRADPVLGAVPEGCETMSNLPNALYPTLLTQWSPRRTALESNDPTQDLPELLDDLSEDDPPAVCLVWIDEDPFYGHLYDLDALSEHLDLELLDSSDNVAVYRVTAPN